MAAIVDSPPATDPTPLPISDPPKRPSLSPLPNTHSCTTTSSATTTKPRSNSSVRWLPFATVLPDEPQCHAITGSRPKPAVLESGYNAPVGDLKGRMRVEMRTWSLPLSIPSRKKADASSPTDDKPLISPSTYPGARALLLSASSTSPTNQEDDLAFTPSPPRCLKLPLPGLTRKLSREERKKEEERRMGGGGLKGCLKRGSSWSPASEHGTEAVHVPPKIAEEPTSSSSDTEEDGPSTPTDADDPPSPVSGFHGGQGLSLTISEPTPRRGRKGSISTSHPLSLAPTISRSVPHAYSNHTVSRTISTPNGGKGAGAGAGGVRREYEVRPLRACCEECARHFPFPVLAPPSVHSSPPTSPSLPSSPLPTTSTTTTATSPPSSSPASTSQAPVVLTPEELKSSYMAYEPPFSPGAKRSYEEGKRRQERGEVGVVQFGSPVNGLGSAKTVVVGVGEGDVGEGKKEEGIGGLRGSGGTVGVGGGQGWRLENVKAESA